MMDSGKQRDKCQEKLQTIRFISIESMIWTYKITESKYGQIRHFLEFILDEIDKSR